MHLKTLSALLWLVCASTFAANLVEDPSFEAGSPFVTEAEGNSPGKWAMYLGANSGGAFTLDGEGRRGNCVLYSRVGDGTANVHLNQVIPTQPGGTYMVEAWVKGDGVVQPFFAVSGMNWRHLATAKVSASEAWQRVRFFFNAGTNRLVRFEWWGGATGSPYTGISGMSRLDDVAVVALTRGLQVAVSVDTGKVVKGGLPPRPIGVSENVFLSSDRHYPDRKISQVETLKQLGGSTVRGMEGNIGDFLIWSVPPYEKPAIRAAAWNTGRLYFGDHFNPDGTLKKPMEFDEFLESGLKAGVKDFFYVIGIDALTAERGEWSRLLEDPEKEILAAAEAQARYARARGVHVWFEVGNENDLVDKPAAKMKDWTPEMYADITKKLSMALKKGDPECRVGVNGGFKANKDWFDRILPEVAPYIDFIVAHQYSPESTGSIDKINEALDRSPVAPAVKGRWPLVLTETSSFSPGQNNWVLMNNLAESTRNLVRYLINASRPRVAWQHFWTDRAYGNKPEDGKNAFHPDGGLLPMGRVLSILNESLGDRLVSVTTDLENMRVFATAREDGTVHVFLANVLGIPHRFQIQLNDPAVNAVAEWRWMGTNGNDLNPKWVDRGILKKSAEGFVVELPMEGFARLTYRSTRAP